MTKDEWVLAVLGVDVRTGSGGLAKAQAGWTASRAEVLLSLSALEGAIRAMNDPLSDPAIILVKSISANLTAVPDTGQKVAELRRYLQTDSVVDDAEDPNGFGITMQIRQPLLRSLDAIDRALAQ